jgi:hypothetical protein
MRRLYQLQQVGKANAILKQMENDESKIYDRYLETFKRKAQ